MNAGTYEPAGIKICQFAKEALCQPHTQLRIDVHMDMPSRLIWRSNCVASRSRVTGSGIVWMTAP